MRRSIKWQKENQDRQGQDQNLNQEEVQDDKHF